MTAIWEDEQARSSTAQARPGTAPDSAVTPASAPPPFASALRRLVDQVDTGAVVPGHPHERRLVQRVRAALAAFEAGWTVIGDSENHPD